MIYFLLFFFSSLNAGDKEFISLGCREGAGLFSVFQDVLGLVKYYDDGFYNGIEVDFGTGGLYYDSQLGENFWTYYCDPICLGSKTNVRKVIGDAPFLKPWEISHYTPREVAFSLIQKYIHLKPAIQEKIDQFKKDHFDNSFIIGIHYRGTDKTAEAPLVDYSRVGLHLKQILNKHGRHCKIFVATDEHLFIRYLTSKYKHQLIYNHDADRSHDRMTPIHLNNSNPYKCGEDAILDAYLLSECDILIRTSSNLSNWSTFLNPALPVIQLN